MKITFHPPLDRLPGAVKELNFSQPVSLADVFRLLEAKMPLLGPYVGFGPQDKQAYGLLVWRDEKLLVLEDTVLPTDKLEMIVMAGGG